jgi:beta-lactam-binding protein with PASTA domain
VPRLVGRSPDDAEAALDRRHCYLGPVRFRHSVKAKRGAVVAQRPRPGTRQVNDSTYRIYPVDLWIGKR